MENMSNLFNALDSLLQSTDLKDVTSESSGFSDLPEGYYLSEVEKAEIKESKTSKQPMVAFQFKIVEDGVTTDENGEDVIIKGSKNRKIFMYYVLKDEPSLKRFVTDALKFEGDVEGEPILGKEYFTNTELLVDALDILVGLRIFVHVEEQENKDGTTSYWNRLTSWKRAKELNLPM